MNKKIFLSFLTLTFLVTGVFLFFNVAKSATIPPEENPLCWLKKDCLAERKKQGWKEGGFIIDNNECPDYAVDGDENYKWGKCLPGAITTAQVSFAGKEQFYNIGDYIKTIYNYSLIILAILASVMIIVAGIQYISSAGSQEMISSAKKRIFGALIGLSLAYASYIILNIINPYTVNLRLPQVFMLKPDILIVQEGEFCDARPNTPSALACAAQSKGNERYYCTPVGVDPEQCGIVDLRTCPCASAAEFIGEVVSTLATIGPGTVISIAEAAAGVAGKVSMKATIETMKTGAIKLAVPKKFLTEKTVKEAFLKQYKEVIKGELKTLGPGEFEMVADKVINKGIVMPTLKIAGQYTWHVGKLGGAAAGTAVAADYTFDWTTDAAAWAWRKMAESKEIRPGICSKNTLREGSLCDMEKDLCATGKCIAFPGLGGNSCWTGNSQIGVCSSGKVNSFCNSENDCANGNKCVAFASIGSLGGVGGNKIQACSDGTAGAPCSEDGDCKASLKCANGYCIRSGAGMVIGSICENNNYCNEGRCYNLAPDTVTYNNNTKTFSFSGETPFMLEKSAMTRNVGSYVFTYDYGISEGVCVEKPEDIFKYKSSIYSYWGGMINNEEKAFYFDGSSWGG